MCGAWGCGFEHPMFPAPPDPITCVMKLPVTIDTLRMGFV
jgi:hypothetical protein